MNGFNDFITWLEKLKGISLIILFIFAVWFICFDSPASTPDFAGVWARECWDYGLSKED